MTEMKALLRFPGARKLVLTDCPIPTPENNALLIKTNFSLISPGTEFAQASQTRASLLKKAWQRPDLVALTLRHMANEGFSRTLTRVDNRLSRPMPMGYCAMGTVEATGNLVTGFAPGQRVAIAGMGQANHAQWNTVSVNLACPVPDAVPDRHAAFSTLYALALHALRQGDTTIGHRVAIIGAGLIGQIVAQTARAAGALVTIIEPNAKRRNLANRNTKADCHASAGNAPDDHYDSVYICAPGHGRHPLIDTAARLCRDRGLIVCVGDVAISGTRKALFEKEITLRQVRSYGPGRYDPNYEDHGVDYPLGHVRWTINRNMQAALALMADGRLDPSPLITSEIGFENIADHFTKDQNPDDLATLVNYHKPQNPPAKAPVPAQDKPATPAGAIRVGVIGTGNYFGGSLLPHLAKRDDVEITACCSKNGLSAMALARKTPGARALTSAEELFSARNINSIIITTRHDSHAELAAAAIAAQKHVWLEKPIAIDQAGLDQLREQAMASSTNCIFMVGHNRRYAPMSAHLRASLPQGSKQFRYRVRIRPLPADHWICDRRQGGRTISEISHFIDLIKSLTDSALLEITCHWLDRTAGDSIWHMHFADGSIGEVSYLQGNRREPKERLEIDAPNFTASLIDWKKLQINGRTVLRARFSQDKGQSAAIDAFAKAVSTGRRPELIPSLPDEINLMSRILNAANHHSDQCGPT